MVSTPQSLSPSSHSLLTTQLPGMVLPVCEQTVSHRWGAVFHLLILLLHTQFNTPCWKSAFSPYTLPKVLWSLQQNSVQWICHFQCSFFFFFLVFLLKFLCLLTLYLLGSIPSTYYPTHIPKCSSPLYDKWSDWSLPLYSYQLNFWVRNAINLIISVTRRVSLAGTSTCQFQNPLQTYSLALYTSVAFILQASPLLLPFPTNLLLSCVVSLVLCQSPSSLSYLNSFLFSTCS